MHEISDKGDRNPHAKLHRDCLHPFNRLEEDELERLAILSEDCAEVIQMVQKIIRHGYESTNPDVQHSPSNRIFLSREVGQLRWIIDEIGFTNDIDQNEVKGAYDCRGRDIQQYLHHHKIKGKICR